MADCFAEERNSKSEDISWETIKSKAKRENKFKQNEKNVYELWDNLKGLINWKLGCLR